jgi:hypothetical protein
MSAKAVTSLRSKKKIRGYITFMTISHLSLLYQPPSISIPIQHHPFTMPIDLSNLSAKDVAAATAAVEAARRTREEREHREAEERQK